MNRVSFPLKVKMQGAAIADLQDALIVCLERGLFLPDEQSRLNAISAIKKDRTNLAFEGNTSKVLSSFQKEHDLPASGEVDERTANALNTLLRNLGLLDQQPAQPDKTESMLVSGQVLREDGRALQGLQVAAVHEMSGTRIRLGTDTTDVEGRYSIRYLELPKTEVINLRVLLFSAEGKSLDKSAIIQGAKPFEVINFVVAGIAVEPYKVTGKISGRLRPTLTALDVVIVDKGVGGDQELVRTTTSVAGNYKAMFSEADIVKRGKTQPDLQVHLFSGNTLLGSSDIRFNASHDEILDIIVDENASAVLESEHTILTKALRSQFQGKLGELKETAGQQDISYLANKTGWDARAVALAALADQFSNGSAGANNSNGIPQEYFYALFRAGVPANENALYRTETKTLKSIWTKAATDGIIPKVADEKLDKVIGNFQELSEKKLLNAPSLTGTSSLKEILLVSGLDENDQKAFAKVYVAHGSDKKKLWETLSDSLGAKKAEQVKLNGKLSLLTINNASLMKKVHSVSGNAGLADPSQLAQFGLHQASAWKQLLTTEIPIPTEIPGATPEVKRDNYADYLAAQIRLSYPTASVAQMIKSGALNLHGTEAAVTDDVHDFLTKHQGKFEISTEPITGYIGKNKLPVPGKVVKEIKRIQRVYQITPNDQAMSGLFKRGMDAAYHVVKYDKDAFIKEFAKDTGSADDAAKIYDKSVQVHNTVLNIALSYLTARNAPAIGVHSPANILNPAPVHSGDVIAYATLESLFGSMDFCSCEHCHSILSPAAYLVDLLEFIDQSSVPAGTENPQAVLLGRRPDLQHLPLTCDNTNTALPYIDVVNETLEYFIANNTQKLSLQNYTGYDTNGIASEDLLASPQYVMDAAYTALRSERFPMPLPFHQPLENLRRYFNKFEVPLPLVMEKLRKGNQMERGTDPYGWRDILMEAVRLSRDEYQILTDAAAVPLWRMYGFPDGTPDTDVISGIPSIPGICKVKSFTQRIGITYGEIIDILKTGFVNPNSFLVPKLERLGVPFAVIQGLKDSTITDNEFDAMLPVGSLKPDPAEYDGDIKAWIRKQENYDRIMSIIVLADPSASPNACNFDTLEFRYSKPMSGAGDTTTRPGAVEFVRLMRFVRLWKKSGWTIEQTDAAICALYRADCALIDNTDVDSLAKLDAGFGIFLPRLGVIMRVMEMLNLSPKKDLLPLLACWSVIGIHGKNPLYRQMFLNPSLLRQDAVFADNGYGEFLKDTSKKLANHAGALQSAFNLTGEEYNLILDALGFDNNTALSLLNISAIFRRGWLARKLKISVRELLLIIQSSGLDPFAIPDAADPALPRLVRLLQLMKDRSFKLSSALYLVWNHDLNSKFTPAFEKVAEFARMLRVGLAGIEKEFAVAEDPDGVITQSRMSKVYGSDATAFFFGLLNDTLILSVPFSDPDGTLTDEAARTNIENAGGKTNNGSARIAYDDFKKQLSYAGVLTTSVRDQLKSTAGNTAITFNTAVDDLFSAIQNAITPFYEHYPELQSVFEAYSTDTIHSVPVKRSILLNAILPDLVRRRKRQLVLQLTSSTAKVDAGFAESFLESAGPPFPFHASGQSNQAALNDFLSLDKFGLSEQLFANDTATGTPLAPPRITSKLNYAPLINGVGNALPANPTPGAAISGIWNGSIEVPENGFYNLRVETDAGATVSLMLNNNPVPFTQNLTTWSNATPLELKAGKLYPIAVKVEKVNNIVRLTWEWQPKGQGRNIVPERFLYPDSIFQAFNSSYQRFLKVASLATALKMTANEMLFFATHTDYQIGGKGWLNALTVSNDTAPAILGPLLKPLQALLDFSHMKAAVSPDDESLLEILKAPLLSTQTPGSILFSITPLDQTTLNDLLSHFGWNIADLNHFEIFKRVYDASLLIQKSGISCKMLVPSTTNDPAGDTVRNLQAALRARYDATDWRDVVKPVNDEMRGLQRDALVALILHQMRIHPQSAHINTADKLFEYFLMDVKMEPCMLTSRIRHALSSVQLFIERCLMNLEPRVSPSAINSQQWQWMKRYRVWEANRKVFLYPENWLEAELRDNKSPFFKEIESELLQSDVTEERAAIAMLNYLSKLEEVAKLETCGIFHIPADPEKRTSEINHVISRTSGANRKYYYCRYEGDYWTPWEQVKLEIEDNPLIPVVWNNRLFVFFLRILKQAPDSMNPAGNSNGNPENLSGASISETRNKTISQTNTKVKVQAVLCWSEYYNSKWQPMRTSDVSEPLLISEFEPKSFDRSKLRLSALFWTRGGLRIIVSYENSFGVSFFLHNAFSLPDLRQPKKETHFPSKRTVEVNSSNLVVNYNSLNTNNAVLTNEMLDRAVQPNHPIDGDPWDVPFFYEDNRHVFYVTTSQELVSIAKSEEVFIDVRNYKKPLEIPPLVLELPRYIPDPVGPITRQPGFGFTDPSPAQRFVSEDAYIHNAIGTIGTVKYGETEIGVAGSGIKNIRNNKF